MDSRGARSDEQVSAVGATTVRDVVQEVVTEVAPVELPVLEGLFQSDDATVVRRLGRRRERREPLGFGLGEVAVLVTPVVWLALDQAARQFGSAAGDSAATSLRAVTRRVLRRGGSRQGRRTRTTSPTVPPLTREQLTTVYQCVQDQAARRGLDTERAAVIADAVVARLALTASGGGPTDPDPAAGQG